MSVFIRSKQRGLSLIELLVSLLITGIIMAGVINSLLATKKAYVFDEQIAYIQENARFALDIIARDLRGAGYMGGCDINKANVAWALDPQTGSQGQFIDSLQPLRGFEGGVNAFPSAYATSALSTAADSLIIRRADSNSELTITADHSSNSSSFLTTDASSISPGDILLLASSTCDQVGIFAATAVTATQIDHNSGAGGSSSNCSNQLGDDFSCVGGNPTNASPSVHVYREGSAFFKIITRAYYIGASSFDATMPSLHVSGISSTGTISSEELVSGVEDLQISYGVDTEPTQRDGLANVYLTADSITLDTANAGSNWRGWDRVVSVRLDLRMRSREPVLLQNDPTFGDKYMRQNVSSTVRLRNAVLPSNEGP